MGDFKTSTVTQVIFIIRVKQVILVLQVIKNIQYRILRLNDFFVICKIRVFIFFEATYKLPHS